MNIEDKKYFGAGGILLMLFVWFVVLFGLSGCSANKLIQRAIKKDPTILVKDTIKHVDTINFFTNRVEVDSVFMVSNDTVTIVKDNLTIRHFIHNDSVFISGECDTIFTEIIRTIEIPTEKIIIKDPLFPKWLIWFLALLVLFILVGRFRR
jgi:hypothetical protein